MSEGSQEPATDRRDAEMEPVEPVRKIKARRKATFILRVAAAVIASAAALVAFAILVLSLAPEWLRPDEPRTPKDRVQEIGGVRTSLLALLAGLVASAGAIFTGLTWRLNQRGQITDRFTKAVDQLGNARPDVRDGGIYALEQIARDAPRTHHAQSWRSSRRTSDHSCTVAAADTSDERGANGPNQAIRGF